MRSTHKLILTILAITLGSVIVSAGVTDVVSLLIGMEADWRRYVLAILVPAIATPVWLVPLARANQQLTQMQSKLERQAHIDPLSSLPNRRALFERAGKIFSDGDENGHPVTVMMVDVDCFKEINDGHGHDIGDAVIRAVAGALQRAVGKIHSESVVARIGGEEFAVVVSRLSEGKSCALAEDICKSVRQLASAGDDLALMVTVSVGVAPRGPGEPIDRMLKIADDAVYAAKRAGRNQWRLATRGRDPARVAPSRRRSAQDPVTETLAANG